MYVLALLNLLAYWHFNYFIERESFFELISVYSFLFGSFIYFYKNSTKKDLKVLTLLAFGIRASLILSTPNLSQDFYRFIWDGNLSLYGINPYLYTPNKYLELGLTKFNNIELMYSKMGELSASHYTNYPPLKQFIFYIAAYFSKFDIRYGIIVLKAIIILFDFGCYFLTKNILLQLNINPKKLLLYILNPFIIIELTGNLHFEGVQVFMLLVCIFFYLKNKSTLSGVFLAASVLIKMIPLVLAPILFFKLKLKNKIQFTISCLITIVIFSSLFINETVILNFKKTTELWFSNFEYNGSIYNIFKHIGILIKGYNPIKSYGTPMSLLVFSLVMLLAIIKRKKSNPKSLFKTLTITLFIFYALSTTVHPWYISTLLILSIFTNYTFVVAWSFTIMLSYFTYSNSLFKENYIVIFIEYAVVYYLFINEVLLKKTTFITSFLKEKLHF